ncbi:hypothetical protein [Sphingobium herbicidovorans]|nr:hypothetical protein [Sphingobium herbicidovorans]
MIEIVLEPFGAGFDVRVLPPVSGENLDAEFKDYRKARRWATGLRINHGWRIRDRTGLADA